MILNPEAIHESQNRHATCAKLFVDFGFRSTYTFDLASRICYHLVGPDCTQSYGWSRWKALNYGTRRRLGRVRRRRGAGACTYVHYSALTSLIELFLRRPIIVPFIYHPLLQFIKLDDYISEYFGFE